MRHLSVSNKPIDKRNLVIMAWVISVLTVVSLIVSLVLSTNMPEQTAQMFFLRMLCWLVLEATAFFICLITCGPGIGIGFFCGALATVILFFTQIGIAGIVPPSRAFNEWVRRGNELDKEKFYLIAKALSETKDTSAQKDLERSLIQIAEKMWNDPNIEPVIAYYPGDNSLPFNCSTIWRTSFLEYGIAANASDLSPWAYRAEKIAPGMWAYIRSNSR